MASATGGVTPQKRFWFLRKHPERPGQPPKHILVNGHKLRFRLPRQLIFTLVTISLAEAAVAALYYLLFEVRYGPVYLKPSWDGLFNYSWWTVYRHGLRDVGEGVLANLAIRSLIVKWQKHWDEHLTGGELAWTIAKVVFYSLVMIVIGIWLVNYAFPFLWHHARFHLIKAPVHNSVAGNVTGGFSWQNFVLGFVITHVIRMLWRPVGNTISAGFIDRQVARASGRIPLWVKFGLAPPTLIERFAWTQQEHPEVVPHKDFATRVVMFLTVVGFLLACYGEYVLHVIAKG